MAQRTVNASLVFIAGDEPFDDAKVRAFWSTNNADDSIIGVDYGGLTIQQSGPNAGLVLAAALRRLADTVEAEHRRLLDEEPF